MTETFFVFIDIATLACIVTLSSMKYSAVPTSLEKKKKNLHPRNKKIMKASRHLKC